MGNAATGVISGQVLIPRQVGLRSISIGRIPVVNIERACKRICAVGARYAAGFR